MRKEKHSSGLFVLQDTHNEVRKDSSECNLTVCILMYVQGPFNPYLKEEIHQAVGEPVYCAYQLAKLSPLLLCHPSCQGDRCHSPGLSDGDDALSSDAGLIQVLGDLSGLPRASLP